MGDGVMGWRGVWAGHDEAKEEWPVSGLPLSILAFNVLLL
jgi:hypothetical protein